MEGLIPKNEPHIIKTFEYSAKTKFVISKLDILEFEWAPKLNRGT